MQTKATSFIIMASGDGSNAQALAQTALEHNYPLVSVISNNPQAGVIQKMNKLGVTTHVMPSDANEQLMDYVKSADIKWVFLAGYMKLLPLSFLRCFYDTKLQQNRVINIHPSLLPQYPGLNAYERAFNNGDKKGGISIHYVDEGMDTGKLIYQQSFDNHYDNLAQFKQAGLRIEHEAYVEVLHKVMQGTV